MSLATRRQIGGTSTIWGGRCVPYDPVDFDDRPWITDHGWPLSYDTIAAYFQRTCDWFACGRAIFDAEQTGVLPLSLTPGLPNEEVRTSTLERWSLPTNFGREYLARLRNCSSLRLITGATCTEIATRDDRKEVDHLVCRTLEGRRLKVSARRYVIACGALESTRLLLASTDRDGRAIGNHSDHLGRWYMGHVEGVVANLRLTNPPRTTIHEYERDLDGVYVRRRFSFSRDFQHAASLPNSIAWLAHPLPADARHRSGTLSFAYLALASPFGRLLAPDALRLSMIGERVPGAPSGSGGRAPIRQHLRNLALDPAPTTRFVLAFGAKRFLARGRRSPGFSVYSRDNLYPLHYHCEHLPHHDSRVTLAEDRDPLGMPKLRIEIRFSAADVDGAVRAHQHWDEYLRRHGAGQLEYLGGDVADDIRRSLGGGFHQTGTTRMSARAADGVVDRDLAVHGVPMLHIASSSTFPTSSQANPTFTIVLFAVRLAEHLRRELS
jgi:choline dehydrogenase-like flavoprotein